MKALDFFCGAGGLTCGMLDAGIEVVAGFDHDVQCKQTYEYNNGGARFIASDIREIDLGMLRQHTGISDFSEMLFAGCAPCQPFSSQTKVKRHRPDATLLGEFGRIIESARPRYVIVENVPGIAKVRGYSTFQRFLCMLDSCNYEYVYSVLDAKNYGVPQNRRRMILIASRVVTPTIPRPRFGKGLSPYRTVRKAIAHFPRIEAGESNDSIPNHTAASISAINLKRLSATPKDGGNRKSWPEKLRLDCHTGNYKGHTDVYGRMAWDKPSPALTSRCNSISNGRYGHPEQDRAISLREAAAIQTFPDGYIFFGSNKHIARQIGNAVPVTFAAQIAKHVVALSEIVELSR